MGAQVAKVGGGSKPTEGHMCSLDFEWGVELGREGKVILNKISSVCIQWASVHR